MNSESPLRRTSVRPNAAAHWPKSLATALARYIRVASSAEPSPNATKEEAFDLINRCSRVIRRNCSFMPDATLIHLQRAHEAASANAHQRVIFEIFAALQYADVARRAMDDRQHSARPNECSGERPFVVSD